MSYNLCVSVRMYVCVCVCVHICVCVCVSMYVCVRIRARICVVYSINTLIVYLHVTNSSIFPHTVINDSINVIHGRVTVVVNSF